MGKQFVIGFRLILVVAVCLSSLELGFAQSRGRKTATRKKDDGVAVIRGQIAYDKKRIKSWDGNRLVIPYEEIEAKIRERIVPPAPPYPSGYQQWEQKKLIDWELEFIKTTRGKKFLENRKKLIENANAFDVKFEKDGKFVIYDVPYGRYGIQGRTDKEINGKKYAFEVFGEIPVEKGMDEIPLNKMRVEVTPLIQPDELAPPVGVYTHDNKMVLNLKHAAFKEKMVFVNFWYSKSPTAAAEQKMIQDMYVKLKDKHPIKLVSICVDGPETINNRVISKKEARVEALKFIRKNVLKEGSHGFTSGVDHKTIFDFGVRSYPSFWLVGTDRKVMMTQYEVAQAMQVKPDMKTIVEDRILGKDTPTLAKPPTEATSKKPDGSDKKAR